MRRRHDKTVVRALLVFGALSAVGCQLILGIQIPDGDTGSAAGASGASGNGPTGGAGSGACADCLQPVWSQSLDGPGDQLVNDVAADAAGNVIFVGSVSDSSDFKGDCPVDLGASCPISAQDQDAYIVKLSEDGEPVWVRSPAAADAQEATAVAVDGAGDVFVAGNFLGAIDFGQGALMNPDAMTQDVFVVKFGPDGTLLWSQRFGDSADQRVGGIAVDGDNNVLLVGQFVGKIDFLGATAELTSAGGYDVFVAKLDGSSGAGLWSESFGDATGQIGNAIAVAPGGQIAITGQCTGSFPLNAGKSLTCDPTTADMFVMKLDSTGACLWGVSHGTGGADLAEGQSISMDGEGNTLVTGRYFADIDFLKGNMHSLSNLGGADTFVTKLDKTTGDALWSRSLASAGDQSPKRIVIADDKVFVAGSMGAGGAVDFGGKPLASGGGVDAFVVSYDLSTGEPICGVAYGDGKDQTGAALALSSAGELIFGASFKGSMDLMCSQSATSSSLNDALVTKLKPRP